MMGQGTLVNGLKRKTWVLETFWSRCWVWGKGSEKSPDLPLASEAGFWLESSCSGEASHHPACRVLRRPWPWEPSKVNKEVRSEEGQGCSHPNTAYEPTRTTPNTQPLSEALQVHASVLSVPLAPNSSSILFILLISCFKIRLQCHFLQEKKFLIEDLNFLNLELL